MAVQPFKIEITDSVLDDLNSGLARNLDYVKELVEYWRTKFDWRAQENLINSYRPLPRRCRSRGSRSAWMVRVGTWTTSSWSGCGGASSTRRCI